MVVFPLQLVDTFLFNFNIGDVLLLVAVLGAVGMLARGSNKLFGLHLVSFGLLFVVLPGSMLEPAAGSVFTSVAMYKFVGLALLVLSPVIFATSRT